MFSSRRLLRSVLLMCLLGGSLARLGPPGALAQMPKRILPNGADSPHFGTSVHHADVDGDGDTDLLSASLQDNKIAWYENDGNLGFPAHVISTSAAGAESVYAADLDGDEDPDVLSASRNDDTIAWYENNGSGTFTARTITTSASGAKSVFATDVDGDGAPDVLSASTTDDKIAWYENDGSGGFVTHTITTSADGAESVYATDVDSDGDTDVLSASLSDDKIAWYENDGSESFTTHVITTSVDKALSVYAADVDSDGDIDVVSGGGDSNVAWHENDGNESFSTHQIATSTSGSFNVYATDLDGDNDVDVLSADDGLGSLSRIAWYENDGSEGFTAHPIDTFLTGNNSVTTADINGDGAPDVLSASNTRNVIAWHENDGSGGFSSHYLTHSRLPANDVSTTDIDGDEDVDVFSGENSGVIWFENDGSETFEAHPITTSKTDAQSVFATDVDEDGDTDILSAHSTDSVIAWHENNGASDPRFTTHEITTSATFASGVHATDVDGDTDIDVLTATLNEIRWYENDGSSDPSFTTHTVTSNVSTPLSVFATDVDGDGDADILSAVFQDDKVTWYENNGSGGFTDHVIASVTDPRSVYAADVDSDGDIDALSSSGASSNRWYENDGSSNPSFSTHTVSINGEDEVYATDVDGDSDTDILYTNLDKITLLENDGSQNFTAQTVTTEIDNPQSVYASDVDSDGDPDPLSGDFSRPEVAWYENDDIDDVRTRTIEGTDGTGDPDDVGWRLLAAPAIGTTRGDLEDDLDFNVDSGHLLHRWEGGSTGWSAATNSTDLLPHKEGFVLYFFDDSIDEVSADGLRLDVPAGSENLNADQSVSGLTQSHQFHLLGNPYTVSFDLSDLVAGGIKFSAAGFQAAVMVWDPSGSGQWTTITEDSNSNNDRIAAWQGFFIERVSSGSGPEDLTFQAEGKNGSWGDLIGSKVRAASSRRALVDLSLRVSQDGDRGATDKATVFFGEGAGMGWDAYEASQLPPPQSNAYVMLSSPLKRDGALVRRLQASRSYPTGTDTVTVPFSVRSVETSGTARLGWLENERPAASRPPTEWTLELEDTETGDRVDLRSEKYAFDVSAGDGQSLSDPEEARFRLHVVPSSAIPVELAGLEASLEEGSVRLTWQTASETNNAGFAVQRRESEGANGGGGAWTDVGFVEGSGTTSEAKRYRFTDADLPYAADSLVYRLRQVDTDGTARFSEAVSVGRGAPERLALQAPFPNPTGRQATLRFAVPERLRGTEVRIAVYDLLGRRVATVVEGRWKAGRHEQRLDVGSWAAGTYFLRLTAEGEVRTRKLTVVR